VVFMWSSFLTEDGEIEKETLFLYHFLNAFSRVEVLYYWWAYISSLFSACVEGVGIL